MPPQARRKKNRRNRGQKALKDEASLPACKDPWLAEISHTCQYCAKIVVSYPPDYSAFRGLKIQFGTVIETREAAAKGCLLCQNLLDECKREGMPVDDQARVEFYFAGTGFDLSIGNVDVGVRKIGRWALQYWAIATHADDPAARYITTPAPNLDVSSRGAFEFAKECLEECVKNHKDCRPPTPADYAPSRLIEIGAGKRPPRLIQTPNNRVLKYAALSYCWGGDQVYKTTASNIVGYRREILLPPTSKTMHDAITTTRNLGLKYLWVDALCIIQDKPTDLVNELARMPDIYKGAYVTIVAATSASSTEGFLEPRRPLDPMYRLPYQCPTGELGSIVLFVDDAKPYLGPYPIKTRAWTLQEEVLSTRTLTFGREVMSWACGQGNFTNGGRNHPLEPRYRELSADVGKAMDEWKWMVQNYSEREMTNRSDKFNAIASIAAEVGRKLKRDAGNSARYIAGLWDDDLSAQLLWKTVVLPPSKLLPRPEPNNSPSWSWASIDNPILYVEETINCHGSLWWQAELKSQILPYGDVTRALLAVVGRVRKAVWMKGRHYIQDEEFREKGLDRVASTRPDSTEHDGQDESDLEVWCLELAVSYHDTPPSVVGLILRPFEGQQEQSMPMEIVPPKTMTASACLRKEKDVGWDNDAQAPVLEHAGVTQNWKAQDKSILCQSHLFRRVGLFDLPYSTLGVYDGASEEEIEEHRQRKDWFKTSQVHLVYIM